MMMHLRKHIKWLLPVFIVSIAALFYWANMPYAEVKKIMREMETEQDIIKKFGNPDHKFTKADRDYYIKGYAYKEREITNKALVYFPMLGKNNYHDIILYVYIDNKGEIENYFVGGS